MGIQCHGEPVYTVHVNRGAKLAAIIGDVTRGVWGDWISKTMVCLEYGTVLISGGTRRLLKPAVLWHKWHKWHKKAVEACGAVVQTIPTSHPYTLK